MEKIASSGFAYAIVRERKLGRIAGGVDGRSTTVATDDPEGAEEEDDAPCPLNEGKGSSSRGRASCFDLAACTERVSRECREGRRARSPAPCELASKRPWRYRCLSFGQGTVDISRNGAVSIGIVRDFAVLFIVSTIAVSHSRSMRKPSFISLGLIMT